MSDSLPLDRRTFLALLGAGAAATTVAGCAPEADTPEEETEPQPRTAEPGTDWEGVATASGEDFPMGLTSGDPTEDAVIFWTRYTGTASLTLSLAVWDGSAWGPTEAYDATPDADGYVHLDLPDLPDDAPVAFQFHDADGQATAVATTRTAPSPTHDGEVRLGVGSCFDQDHLAFPSLTHVVNRGPLDAFLFLGDTAYFDGYQGTDAFRQLWTDNLTADGFTQVREATSGIFMFDDHEFINDFAGETIDPARFRLGMDSFLEATPVRRDEGFPDRVWRSFRFGATVEVFCTDTRSERTPSTGEMISAAQLQWLVDGVIASDATWKVIATAVPYASFTGTPWDVPPLTNDKWDGFSATRTRILDALTEAGVQGVLFVSGDVHCGFLARVEGDGPASKMFDVCCGPGGSFLNPAVASLPDGERIYWGQAVHHSTRFVFSSKGTVTVEVVGEEDETWARFVLDTDGNVSELTALDPNSPSVRLRLTDHMTHR